MIDTITLLVKSADVPSIDFMAELPLMLGKIKEEYDPKINSYKVKGSLGKAFHATVSTEGLLLTGSLCKEYFGNNQQTLTLADTCLALTRLFNELGLPIEHAYVYRVDIGANYIMESAPETYYPYFGDAMYYARSVLNTSLYYKNKSRQIIFYDKLQEQEAKHVPTIEEYIGKNVLRFEYRIRRGLAERMEREDVRALDLCDPTFYKSLLEKYQEAFMSIEKYSLVDFDPIAISDSKSFFNQLALLGIQSIGGQMVLNDILSRAKKQGLFPNAMSYKRLKDRVKTTCNTPLLTCKSPLVDELSNKVAAKVAAEILSLSF